MTSTPDDASLVDEVLAGSPSAFSVLVKRYTDRLYRVVFAVVGEGAAAEDVLQETFLRAYAGLASFSRRSQFRTWLYRIALNEAYRARRSVSRQRERPFSQLGGDALRPLLEERAAPASPGDESRRHVLELLDGLPREYREAMLLRHVDGLSYVEIAEVLGTTAGTVGSWLHRAREVLRERVHDRGTD